MSVPDVVQRSVVNMAEALALRHAFRADKLFAASASSAIQIRLFRLAVDARNHSDLHLLLASVLGTSILKLFPLVLLIIGDGIIRGGNVKGVRHAQRHIAHDNRRSLLSLSVAVVVGVGVACNELASAAAA